jgi:hypothetical protein
MKLCHWEIIAYEMWLHELCRLRILKDQAVKEADYETAVKLRDEYETIRHKLRKTLTATENWKLDNDIIASGNRRMKTVLKDKMLPWVLAERLAVPQ